MSNPSYRAYIRNVWYKAVNPPVFIKETVIRRRIQFLNSFLISFIFLSPIILVVQLILIPDVELTQDSTPKAIIMGMVAAMIIYGINRTPYYRIANYVAILIGYSAALANAIASQPPHLEILYLIILPLIGIILLSVVENIVVSIMSIAALILFVQVVGGISDDIFKDMITFSIFVEAVIIFASYQRNSLEADRQRQVIENAKSRMMAQFIQDISHEFRTPLSVISTGVYLLEKTVKPEARQERVVQIQSNIEVITKLFEDILTMTRLDTRVVSTSNTLALDSLVQEMVTAMQPNAAAKGLTLDLTLQPNIPKIQGDRDEFQLAIKHLLKNAIAYTTHGGVKVRVFTQQTAIVIEIEDTGIGISESEFSNIFERFYRVDQARTLRGAGLGLAITKKIIEDYHGKIELSSVPEKGSQFRVIINT